MLLVPRRWSPLVGAIVVFALPRGRDLLAKQVTLLFSLGRWRSRSASASRSTTTPGPLPVRRRPHEWIRSLGVSFSLGVDGIALVLIALAAVLVPAVVIASWSERDRGRRRGAGDRGWRPGPSAAW